MDHRQNSCYLCELTADVRAKGDRDVELVDCPGCGRYELSYLLRPDRYFKDDRLRSEASVMVRRATDRGETLTLTTESFPLEVAPRAGVSQMMRRVVEVFGAASSAPGSRVVTGEIHDENRLRLRAGIPCRQTFDFVRMALERQGCLTGDSGSVIVTAKGWDLIEAGGAGVKGTCFVAMSFSSAMNDAFDVGVRLAVELDCGGRAVRVDRIEHADKIDDRITSAIRGAQFVIADVTEHKQGVYFEAGFALGLGRPVIWTCRDNDLANAHFDTRQFNHVVWSDAPDLRVRLTRRLIGMGLLEGRVRA